MAVALDIEGKHVILVPQETLDKYGLGSRVESGHLVMSNDEYHKILDEETSLFKSKGITGLLHVYLK